MDQKTTGAWQKKATAALPARTERGWKELFDRFYIYKASRCEASSLKTVGWYLLPVIKEMEAKGITLQSFSALHYEERVAHRRQSGIISNTCRYECMMLTAMLRLGVREKFLKKNPLAVHEMPPKIKPFVPCPTSSRVKALLKTVHDMRRPSISKGAAQLTREKNAFLWRRDTAIIVLGARTGMRPGEIFRLTMDDYQPEEGQLVIRTAKDHEPRRVPIYSDVIGVVVDWLKVRPKDSATDHLFVSDRGRQMLVNSWANENSPQQAAVYLKE